MVSRPRRQRRLFSTKTTFPKAEPAPTSPCSGPFSSSFAPSDCRTRSERSSNIISRTNSGHTPTRTSPGSAVCTFCPPLLERETTLARREIGKVPSLTPHTLNSHLFLTFASAFYSGILFDKGWFRYQLAIGSVGWLVGIFTLSFATTFWQILLAQSVCMGLSLGLMFSPCLSILGTYFRRKRAFVVGVAASGTAIGAVVFPVLLGQLFEQKGFPTAIRAAGFLMLALLLIANVTIRPRKVAGASSSANTAAAVSTKPPLRTILLRIVRDPAAWIVMVGVFGVYVGCFVPLFYVVSFARQYSNNAAIATYSLSIINSLAFFSRIGSGLVADRCGLFNTAIPLACSVGILTFGMIGATNTAGLAVFLVLFGIAQGGWISVSAALFMSLTNDVNELGCVIASAPIRFWGSCRN